MAGATNDFIVEMLRPIQADIGDMRGDIRELSTRVGFVERTLLTFKRKSLKSRSAWTAATRRWIV